MPHVGQRVGIVLRSDRLAAIDEQIGPVIGSPHRVELVLRLQLPVVGAVLVVGDGMTNPARLGAAVSPGVDRKRVEEGKSVSVRVDLGGRRISKKKKRTIT